MERLNNQPRDAVSDVLQSLAVDRPGPGNRAAVPAWFRSLVQRARDVWRCWPVHGQPPLNQKVTEHAASLWHRIRATAGGRRTMTTTGQSSHRLLMTMLTGIAVAIGIAVAVLSSDVIIGVIAGAGFLAVSVQMVRLWTGHSGPPVSHH